MSKEPKESQKREVDIVHPSYQPNRNELRDDLRVDATFDEAVKALVQPVKVRYAKSPKKDK